jgi:putative heme-binding domain-containing protein
VAKAPDAGKVALVQLTTQWGRSDLLAPQIPAISERLVQALSQGTATDSDRIEAARRLIAINDSKASVTAILGQIHVLSTPGLANGLIGTLAASRIPETSPAVLAHWAELSPTMRRNATALLLRRKEWALGLLGAVEAGTLLAGDLSRDHWSQLSGHSDASVSAKARSLQKAGSPKSSAAMEALITQLQPVALKAGKADHGREVFEKNCIACHVLDGKGGRIGPELTGIGVRPKTEILTEILDPNRSVEANYKLWTLTQKDGESLSGRLDAETATSVEILDTTGTKHVIQRSTIAKLESSGQSIMPGGFEQLPTLDLTDLLEYLATAGAKH